LIYACIRLSKIMLAFSFTMDTGQCLIVLDVLSSNSFLFRYVTVDVICFYNVLRLWYLKLFFVSGTVTFCPFLKTIQ